MDYKTARYRVAFSYGVGASAKVADLDFIRIFEETLGRFSVITANLPLKQKVLVYASPVDVRGLRQSARSATRDLRGYEQEFAGAEQAGCYVYDVLSATEAPTLLCNLHWSASDQIGTKRLKAASSGRVGRFFAIAAEEQYLAMGRLVWFDEFVTVLHRTTSGVRGGLLTSRPYNWNGKAGIEWMYREMTQTIPGGDIEAWDPDVDISF